MVGGGRGKTGSSSPPQIKGADLDVHQRTQRINAQMNRMIRQQRASGEG